MTGWIGVWQGLPKENGVYLCCTRKQVLICRFAKKLSKVDKVDFKGLNRPGWYWFDREIGYFEHTNITHWRELPEIPKEENIQGGEKI